MEGAGGDKEVEGLGGEAAEVGGVAVAAQELNHRQLLGSFVDQSVAMQPVGLLPEAEVVAGLLVVLRLGTLEWVGVVLVGTRV